MTEAPATPDSGTVRVAGGGGGQSNDGTGLATLSGSVMWAMAEHVAADVGLYFQSVGSTTGPAVSWMVTRALQVQALVGVAHPKGALEAGPVGQVFVSMDF